MNHKIDTNIKHQRNLIIGLGGTGNMVARYIQEWVSTILGNHGNSRNQLENIQIISIDTCQQEGSQPKPISSDQFCYIGGFSAGNLIKKANSKDKNSIPEYLQFVRGTTLSAGQIHSGANGVPLVGRLCYVFNYKIINLNLRCAVLKLLDPNLSYTVKSKYGISLETHEVINIHIILSSCGGTGTGLLIDTAICIRNIIEKMTHFQPNITLYLLLPPVFTNAKPIQQTQHQRNTAYIINQIEKIMNRDKDIEQVYPLDCKARLIKEQELFDNIFIINKVHKDFHQTSNHIARFIVSSCIEPIGRQIQAQWDNFREIFHHDKNKFFCSYGMLVYQESISNCRQYIKIKFLEKFNKYIEDIDSSIEPSDHKSMDEYFAEFTNSINNMEISDPKEPDLFDPAAALLQHIDNVIAESYFKFRDKVLDSLQQNDDDKDLKLFLKIIQSHDHITKPEYSEDLSSDDKKKIKKQYIIYQIMKQILQKDKAQVVFDLPMNDLGQRYSYSFAAKNDFSLSKYNLIYNGNPYLVEFNYKNQYWKQIYLDLVRYQLDVKHNKNSKHEQLSDIKNFFENIFFRRQEYNEIEQEQIEYLNEPKDKEKLVSSISFDSDIQRKQDLIVVTSDTLPDLETLSFAQFSHDWNFSLPHICYTCPNCDWAIIDFIIGVGKNDIAGFNDYNEKLEAAQEQCNKKTEADLKNIWKEDLFYPCNG